MQKIIRKSEKGITLLILVITILVLGMISVTVAVNFTQVKVLREYTDLKADLESLNEAVNIAYKNVEDIPTIGPKVLSTKNIKSFDDYNANDSDNYYIINFDTLNSKLSDATKISLIYGQLNKNFSSSDVYPCNYTTDLKEDSDVYVINQITKTIYYIKGVTYNSKLYHRLADDKTSATLTTNVNAPYLSEGMIPIKYNSTAKNWVICSSSDSDWYNYNSANNSSMWANVMLSDGRYKISNGIITDTQTSSTITAANSNTIADKDLGSMFVWIPRYAYKIENNLGNSTAGKISIKFLQGTSNKDFDGLTVSSTYPNVTNNAMDDYVVHPAFTNNVSNGGWDSEISGFWVAKFPAGYQKSTIDSTGNLVNSSDKLVESDLNYSGIDNGYTQNAVDSSLTLDTKMSYPVFKPLTYAYNCIRIGDSYNLARAMQEADFYGLNKSIDSHMEKNSEWGAVSYLAQSSYGRNGTEIDINNYNLNNANNLNVYAITGLYGTTLNASYNTSTGGSSTGNITGVYDLNGCVWEREASYITNENQNLSTYGKSFAYTTAADATPQSNQRSTRWATAYPYDSSNDDASKNYLNYLNLKSSAYGFGDAILETSTSGQNSTSWFSDYSYFVNDSHPFITRGGVFSAGTSSGCFALGTTVGVCNNDAGFRVILTK